MFGQPVKLGGASFGVVRIALGADMLIDAFCGSPSTVGKQNEGMIVDNGGIDRLLAQVMFRPFPSLLSPCFRLVILSCRFSCVSSCLAAFASLSLLGLYNFMPA